MDKKAQNIKQFHYKAERVTRDKPANLNDKDNQLFKNEYSKAFNDVYIKTYHNISLYSNGLCKKNMLLFDLYFNDISIDWKREIKLSLKTALLMLQANKTIEIPNALLVTNHFSNAFFHWFADVLQKLEALEVQNIDTSDLVLLIPQSSYNSYVAKSLEPYSINYIVIEKGQKASVKNLYYIPPIAPTGNYRKNLMLQMHTRFQKHYSVKDEKKRLYITRAKAPIRKIKNESELLLILKRYNFDIVAMEDFSFEEQYRLVAQSNVLVSLHGAGLTHMLWMPENSKVLEIRLQEDTLNNCYFSLASDLDREYYYELASKTDENLTTQKSDFLVDITSIEERLKQLLNEK